MSLNDKMIIEREARKWHKKIEKAERLENQLKNMFKEVLNDPSIKKTIGVEIANAVKSTEAGQLDPLLKKVLDGADNLWSK